MLDPDVALELLDGVREEPAEGAPQRRQHGPPALSLDDHCRRVVL